MKLAWSILLVLQVTPVFNAWPINYDSLPQVSSGQDYSVSDIDCENGGWLSAQLTKPHGFRGNPMFADDRLTDPAAGGECSIRPAPHDTSG